MCQKFAYVSLFHYLCNFFYRAQRACKGLKALTYEKNYSK